MQKCMLVGVALSALLCGCMSESERLAYEQNLRAQREVEQKKYQEEVAKAKRTAAENQAKEESLNREKYWADLAMRNYDFLISGLTYARLKKTGGVPDRDAYIHNPSLRQAKGVKNQNMWQVARAIQSVDLSNWAGPRNGISEGLAQKGRSTMEAFASKYEASCISVGLA